MSNIDVFVHDHQARGAIDTIYRKRLTMHPARMQLITQGVTRGSMLYVSHV
jgi:hypothetical protein